MQKPLKMGFCYLARKILLLGGGKIFLWAGNKCRPPGPL